VLIAQVSDIHIGFHRDQIGDPNLERFRTVIERLTRGPDQPDLLLLTGDLTEHGDAQSYAALVDVVKDCPFPVWPIPGNHDEREALRATFPQVPRSGFINYSIACGNLRLIMLDSLEHGRHGGAFCAERAVWLESELAAHPDVPKVIVLHHPPVPVGIAWMDPDPAAPWIERLGRAIAGNGQIQAILCGHVHRPIASSLGGVPLVICPSSAAGLALDLRVINPDFPDTRALIVDDASGFALHRWNGQNLVTHFAQAPDAPALARFAASLQPMISQMMSEAP
jgi:3',5'-cyclic AMP phosphodiesterase CpdA